MFSIVLFIVIAVLAITGLYAIISAAFDAGEKLVNVALDEAEKFAKNRKVNVNMRAYQSHVEKNNAISDEDLREMNIRRELYPICVEINGGVRVPLKVRFKGATAIQTPTADMQQCINAGLVAGKLYDIDYLDIGRHHTDFAICGVKGQLFEFNSVNFDLVIDDGYYTVIEPSEYDKYNLNGYVTAAQPLSDKVQRLWDEVDARRDAYATAMARTMS